LFVFVYDIDQEFIGVGGEQIGDYSCELLYEPPYLFGNGECTWAQVNLQLGPFSKAICFSVMFMFSRTFIIL
jgi:hypothetical protein